MSLKGDEALLGIDLGTTHCKVGLYARDADGSLQARRLTVSPNRVRQAEGDYLAYDPDELWATVQGAIAEVVRGAPVRTVAVGIASMAETGLLVDRATGSPRTLMIPWFERCAAPQAERLARACDDLTCFRRSGLRPGPKAGLAKLLWLRDTGVPLTGAVWLSAADYVAYRLTGRLGTDPTLAARTQAYDLVTGRWDAGWLARWELSTDLFPPVMPSGAPLGEVQAFVPGLAEGVPVAIAGHDHVCAAFAAGVIEPGAVFDSIGTAETLIGALPPHHLTADDFASGLIYGPHVVPERSFWMSSLSASGGSVEWLRTILGDPPLTYEDLAALLDTADAPAPTGIIYFPYLSGSGAPHANPEARAALVGLTRTHTRADVLRAVLEGVAYEIELTRRAAQTATGVPILSLVAAGGGTKNRTWMQIRADVCGCEIEVLPTPEATLLGAALLAGVGSGIYAGPAEALAAANASARETYAPDPARHARYRVHFEEGYARLLEALQQTW